MIQSNKEALVEYIKLIVESRVREAHLTGGRISKWGSSEHIADLDEQIAEIQKMLNELLDDETQKMLEDLQKMLAEKNKDEQIKQNI